MPSTSHASLIVLAMGGFAALIGCGLASYELLLAIVKAVYTTTPIPDPTQALSQLSAVKVPSASAPLALAAAGTIALLVGLHQVLPDHTPRHKAAKTMHTAALYLQTIGYIAAMLASIAGSAATTILALSTTLTGWAVWLVAAVILAYTERGPKTIVYTITILLANPLSLGAGYPLAALTAWLTWGR